MFTLAWDNRYLIGLPMIDNQHKYLLQLLNNLYGDYASGRSVDALNELFDNLIDYASYHFSLEERWMEGQLYPRLELHRHEHAAFSKRVEAMQHDYRVYNRNVSLEAVTFLFNWLITHIQGSDYDFGCFIQQKSHVLTTCSSTLPEEHCWAKIRL